MNWFERYEIPGIYFVLLFGVFYKIFFGFCINEINLELLTIIITSSLPFGYLFSIASLTLYYLIPGPWQVHRSAWDEAGKNNPHLISKKLSEKNVEAVVAILGRWKIRNIGREVDEGRWLQEWFTKRMNVIAINHTLIVITVFVWISAIVIQMYYLTQKTFTSNGYGLLFTIITFLIFVCLIINTCQLQDQVEKALIPFFTALRNKHLI